MLASAAGPSAVGVARLGCRACGARAEHAEVSELLTSNSAAKELLGFAINRLNKFYNPKLYKAPLKREVSAEDRIAVNMGCEPPPTPAPGGIASTGIAVLAQVFAHAQTMGRDAPPPPPETFGTYTKKSEETSGVIAMIDLPFKDLDKEISLHSSCNWLLQYFDVRKEPRASEFVALGSAKAVLSGADCALMQTRAGGFLWRRGQ